MSSFDPDLPDFLEVTLPDDSSFLKVKETLTRIGISSKTSNKLFQSCHILYKRQRYYIVHFKQMFELDGKFTDFTEDDRARRNTVAHLLEQWNLVNIVDKDLFNAPIVPISALKIIPFKDKNLWELVPKYSIGKTRNTS